MSEPLMKRLVCLANSRKLLGRCIAGIEWDGEVAGSWVRPVSNREHAEVSEDERRYEDSSEPSLLDIINVPLKEARPINHQVENYLLDPKYYWELDGKLSVAELAGFPSEEVSCGTMIIQQLQV